MLSAEEIEAILAGGYELRGFELKTAGPRTDTHLMMKVTRAALSMGNLRDGGHVIIGIDDVNPAAMLPGLGAADLATWLEFDHVARKMAEYADPPLQFDVAQVGLSNGSTVVVIQVFEFHDIPHLCAKGYEQALRKGALYVRPRKVPETSEVASSIEMRDVLELATEKALRSYVETAQRAGIALGTAGSAPSPTGASDDDRFTEQRRGAWE